MNRLQFLGIRAESQVRCFQRQEPDIEAANEKTPSSEGVPSFLLTDFQKESVDVSRGDGKLTRVSHSHKSIDINDL